MKRLLVGCTKFPSMEAGQIGFAINSKSNCMEPNYPFQNGNANGFIHIRNHDELADLAEQIGAMTVTDFFRENNLGTNDSWRNKYIRYLDEEIHRALLQAGIKLTINDELVNFYTEPNYYKQTTI